jgi:peroxiredoxin
MEKPARLTYNDPAPDIEVKSPSGELMRLSSLWQTRPLLLVFTRHFGCPQCKEMLDQIVQAKTHLEQAGLSIAAVTQGAPAETRAFGERRAPGILCLSDPERRVYSAFGLERGNLWQLILSPHVIRETARARTHGNQVELPPPGQDVRQMSGTFIIGTDGRIRLPYYYLTIADHAPIELLLKGVLSTRWDKSFDGPLGSK